ncbi:MAG: NIPSNAP family containing protein [Terracidiphilus sp.]
MKRRQFLMSSLATSSLAIAGSGLGQSATAGAREFYLLRRYDLVNGPQTKLTESYFSDALIPALTRMGLGPIGAFSLAYGPETPAYVALIPGASVYALAQLDLRLAQDAEFMKAAEPFWSAPASAPAFQRVESSLLIAFEGWPKLTPPPMSATKAKRIFQLRTYESPSFAAHVRKVEMFNSGEFEIFKTAGFHPVFFGDALVDTRMPKLTYMLSLNGVGELDAKWAAFGSNPDWKKLSSSPRYAYEPIVSSITNLILTPLGASQL